LRYELSAAMLVLTTRPIVFLLGRGLTGIPTASVLRAVRCRTVDYGVVRL
jgi:hypothetical protein